MIKDAIRYTLIIIIVIGIVLVMKNLINNEGKWETKGTKSKDTDKTEEVYYNANIKLVDKSTEEILSNGQLVVKNANGEVVDSWTTTEEIHIVTKLKPGTYTLEEESAPEGYRLNEEAVTFMVEKKNVDVSIYNEALTEEELETLKAENTSSDEIGVDNTLSIKNNTKIIISLLCLISGILLIMYQSNQKSKLFKK